MATRDGDGERRQLTKMQTTLQNIYAFSNVIVKFCGVFTCLTCKQQEALPTCKRMVKPIIKYFSPSCHISGFGGLVVSVLTSGTQDRGFKPSQSRQIFWYPRSRVQTRPKPSDFSGEKILSAPSFGGEVQLSVSYRRFAAC